MWWRKRHRFIRYIVYVGFLIVIFQLAYPTGRALPFSRVGGADVTFADAPTLQKQLLDTYKAAKLSVHIREKTTTVVASDVGVTPDTQAIVRAVSDYPWWQRLLPLSLIAKGLMTNQQVTPVVSGDGFTGFANELVKVCDLAPTNAAITVKDGSLVLVSAKTGQSCTVDDIREQLVAYTLEKNAVTEVTVKTTSVTPERTDEAVQALLGEASAIVKRPLEIDVLGKTYTPDAASIAQWLVFPEDKMSKKLSVDVGTSAVKKYLEQLQKDVYVAPGITTIYTHDSLETRRLTGVDGQGIDLVDSAVAVRSTLLTGGGRVSVTLAAISPSVRYVRSYSNTPSGLQALVRDLAKGENIAISVRRLADTGANANGDKQYHPASTYKLFVAYSVLKRIDAGSMSWGQAATNGQTVSECFDNMIVNSDNTCAEWFGRTVSWRAVESDARGIGTSHTSFGVNFLSSANDLALLLQKLESNKLGLTESLRGRLIDAMKRQRYRQGIPAGVGVNVADKVGFLDAKLHDAAIVYAPRGVYVLVILSDGSSWTEIASIANQIHTQITR